MYSLHWILPTQLTRIHQKATNQKPNSHFLCLCLWELIEVKMLMSMFSSFDALCAETYGQELKFSLEGHRKVSNSNSNETKKCWFLEQALYVNGFLAKFIFFFFKIETAKMWWNVDEIRRRRKRKLNGILFLCWYLYYFSCVSIQ